MFFFFKGQEVLAMLGSKTFKVLPSGGDKKNQNFGGDLERLKKGG